MALSKKSGQNAAIYVSLQQWSYGYCDFYFSGLNIIFFISVHLKSVKIRSIRRGSMKRKSKREYDKDDDKET
jgi:hypothetical protein